MANARYRPSINARAYTTPLLLARLDLLLDARAAEHQHGSPGRYEENQAIAAELMRRNVASPLLTAAAELEPEQAHPSAGRPARRIRPTVDYPARKAA